MGIVGFTASDGIRIAAPVQRVWALVSDLGSYPGWWPASLRVRADPGGRSVWIHPRGGLRFQCRVEEAEPLRRLRIRYPGPRIVGTGEWRLAAEGGGTQVRYEADLQVALPCARLLARCVDFPRFHSRGMAGVLEGLRRETELREPAGAPGG